MIPSMKISKDDGLSLRAVTMEVLNSRNIKLPTPLYNDLYCSETSIICV